MLLGTRGWRGCSARRPGYAQRSADGFPPRTTLHAMWNRAMNTDDAHPTSPNGGRAWRRVSVGIGIGGIVAATVAGWWYGLFTKSTAAPDERRAAVLNRLRDEINAHYGCDKNGDPHVHFGPCGRFARTFREQWKDR